MKPYLQKLNSIINRRIYKKLTCNFIANVNNSTETTSFSIFNNVYNVENLLNFMFK